MPDDRHDHLYKCAEQVIGLMNAGAKPDAALSKVAHDGGLNPKEVTLVSHAVNNSKTLSHLTNSKADEKGGPFLLTNAEVVNQQLNDSDQVVPGKEKDVEKERKSDLEKKKEAAAWSNQDLNVYLDAPVVDNASVFSQACGIAEPFCAIKAASVKVASDGSVEFTPGRDAHQKIGRIRHMADDARTEFIRARDLAVQSIEKLAGEFRRTDAPKFARIEQLCAHEGCADSTLEVIFDQADLAKYGHKRAEGEKLAGVLEINRREAQLVRETLHVESLLKSAADHLVQARYYDERYGEIETQLSKLATPSMAAQLADDLVAIPGAVTGTSGSGGAAGQGAVDFYGSVAGNTPGEKAPEYKQPNQTPISLHTRQEIANTAGRGQIESLLGDEYIGKHPIQNVVQAFNRARSTNPNLGDAELQSLVRQDLASEGGVPIDTLLRARQAKGTEE
jgi:hypothetical protein